MWDWQSTGYILVDIRIEEFFTSNNKPFDFGADPDVEPNTDFLTECLATGAIVRILRNQLRSPNVSRYIAR